METNSYYAYILTNNHHSVIFTGGYKQSGKKMFIKISFKKRGNY